MPPPLAPPQESVATVFVAFALFQAPMLAWLARARAAGAAGAAKAVAGGGGEAGGGEGPVAAS